VETRKSVLLLPFLAVLDHDPTVLRQPLFADVQLRHDLEAADHGIFQLQRRVHHRLQNAIDAEPHAQLLLVRLDVNVAGAALDRIGQDQVHQLDDRRFLGRPLQRGQVRLLHFGGQLQILRLRAGQVLHHLAELFDALGLPIKLGDGLGDG